MTQDSSPPGSPNESPAVRGGSGTKLESRGVKSGSEGDAQPSAPSRWGRIWSAAQLMVSLALTVVMLVYLMVMPAASPSADEEHRPVKSEAVEPVGPGLVRILPGTSLETKLQTLIVQTTVINSPLLTVTGTVVASLRPGNENRTDFWQFHAAEVLTAYTDWQKATADIAFSEKQWERTKELATMRVESQRKVADRLKKLVQAGTDTPKDLAVEETKFLEFQIQGQKESYEAETAVRMAKRAEAVLARQVQQAGLEPELLQSATSDMDIVLANVPEGSMSAVKIGESCQAKFFGLPTSTFTGKVNRIAPALSLERRSLRILFVIHDPNDQLRPGMFAEIGLGTDDRHALLMPAEGVIHVGRSDYVLVADGAANTWRICEVQVGEPHDAQIEVLSGVAPGNTVVGKGAILLKPAMVRALKSSAKVITSPTPPNSEARMTGAEAVR